MEGITIKLPDRTLRRLRQQAGAAGRSVAALVRERVEAGQTAGPDRHDGSVYAATDDLAGGLAGHRRAATNTRRKFRRP
jgi:plasmid stability protein